MRRLVRSLVFLWPVLSWQGAQAQTPPPNPDEATIQQAAVDFVDAYNAKDASRLTALFGPQARVESAEGAVIEGRRRSRRDLSRPLPRSRKRRSA